MQLLLNHFANKPWFLPVCCKSLLKTLWEKEKLLETSNFSFSHSVFHMPVWRTFCYFNHVQNVRLQTLSVWKSLKFDVWERVDGRRKITLYEQHIFFITMFSKVSATMYKKSCEKCKMQ